MPATSRSATAPSLDEWAPEYRIELRHARACKATPERLWQAALEVRVREAPTLRPLIAWRLGGSAPDPETPFFEVFRRPPFVLLAEGTSWSLSGLAGSIWGARPRYERPADAAAFRALDAPGLAKVVLLHSAVAHPDGAELVSEARISFTDDRAWRSFRPYWAIVGPFARFIGREPLRAACRRA